MGAPSPLGRRLPWVLSLFVALVPLTFALYRLWQHDGWVTAARHVTWVDAGGKVLAEPPICGADIVLRMFADRGRLWVVCEGSYGSVDPTRATGKLAWAIPPALKQHWAVGLLPAESGELALVWLVEGGPLALGVAGESGWVRGPMALPGQGNDTQLLGMSWTGTTLEVVVLPGTPGHSFERSTAPIVFTSRPDGSTAERTIPREAIRCAQYCHPIGAYHRSGSSVWRFFLFRAGGTDVDIGEDGSDEVPLPAAANAEGDMRDVDRTLTGNVDAWLGVKAELLADGRFGPGPTLPVNVAPDNLGAPFLRRGAGRAVIVPRWYLGATSGFLQRVEDRTVVTNRVTFKDPSAAIPDDAEYSIVRDVTDPIHPRESTVATAHDCTSLDAGMLVPRD